MLARWCFISQKCWSCQVSRWEGFQDVFNPLSSPVTGKTGYVMAKCRIWFVSQACHLLPPVNLFHLPWECSVQDFQKEEKNQPKQGQPMCSPDISAACYSPNNLNLSTVTIANSELSETSLLRNPSKPRLLNLFPTKEIAVWFIRQI